MNKPANEVDRVNGLVALKNVAAFMVMTQQLIDRDPHLPGIGVCHGPSGLGKTYSSIFAQNKTDAIRVEVGDTWTKRTLLKKILAELGQPVRERMAAADMAEKVIIALSEDPHRPLIIDEADKCVDKNMIETVRELHEHSSAPVILIGEERLPAKLLGVERVHNRVLVWLPAQPCDLDDTRALAKAFCPKITLAEDVLERIRAASDGRARRIVVNLSRAGEFARNKGGKQITFEMWGREPLYTGEPPRTRPAQAYAKAAA